VLLKPLLNNALPMLIVQRQIIWFKKTDILQLKFFIISYVNSLERRKYVAVWFSSIQERIQCWPAQYSYDLYHVTLDTVLGDHQFFRGIQAVRFDFLNFKSCQYSMFYTNKLFWTKSQVSDVQNRIVEVQKHWRILHENDTKRRIQQMRKRYKCVDNFAQVVYSIKYIYKLISWKYRII
jgi:hypothetical protein